MQKIDKQHRPSGLGAQRVSEEEKEKSRRKSDYAEQLRVEHRTNIKIKNKTKSKDDERNAALSKKHEQRRKILAFAATVPKPVIKKKTEIEIGNEIKRRESPKLIDKNDSELDLERLLARHKSEQARVNRLGQLANIN